MAYSTYRDINYPFLSSQVKVGFPFSNHWQNDPLSPLSWVDPRRDGYRPYNQYVVVTKQEPWINKCGFYQNSCDLYLPVNSCYLKDHEIVLQP